MRVAEEIRRRLHTFDPIRLDLEDQSDRHRGHAGARPGGETHFALLIVSNSFEGKTRVQRQRAVYEALGDLMRERVHALSIIARTPQEAAVSATSGVAT